MAVEAQTLKPTVSKFSMIGTPLLTSGRQMEQLAAADQLWLHAKVYAEGGENSLHAHHEEDHSFFVLMGEATFTTADMENLVVSQFEGVMIPRGAGYCFTSTGSENLVMLRIGAGDERRTPKVDARENGVGSRASLDGGAIRNAGTPVPSGRAFGAS